MASLSNFPITPFVGGPIENVEFNFRNLYLHHIYSGPNPTQIERVSQDAATGAGNIAVNAWTIYDGSGPNAKVVGHARGLHVNAWKWQTSFTLEFDSGRFKGSTLQIMGMGVAGSESEWSIIGGTGDLAMARGVVKRKEYKGVSGGDVQELTMHGFCRMQTPTLTKTGPWGGHGGSITDSVRPWRIESITIVHENVIGLFEYTYVDTSGKRQTGGPWGGGNGANRTKIELGPNEIVKEVSGTYFDHFNGVTSQTVVQSLMFVTNEKRYGPYGRTTGTPFNANVPEDKSVVGFFGRTDNRYLNALGVYTV